MKGHLTRLERGDGTATLTLRLECGDDPQDRQAFDAWLSATRRRLAAGPLDLDELEIWRASAPTSEPETETEQPAEPTAEETNAETSLEGEEKKEADDVGAEK